MAAASVGAGRFRRINLVKKGGALPEKIMRNERKEVRVCEEESVLDIDVHGRYFRA